VDDPELHRKSRNKSISRTRGSYFLGQVDVYWMVSMRSSATFVQCF